ncbi:MAG: hypothetical protein LJE58_01710, partial [Thiogranum sp.]|nr:hypothetical protein [Thiogranum sp.]
MTFFLGDVNLDFPSCWLPKGIQKHENGYQYAFRISVDPVSVSGCVAARDRRTTASAHYLSANYTASPHSPGRPPVSKEIKALIRKLSVANPSWGSPRIVGELRKVGIDVAKSTVDKYRVRSKQPPSPTWKTF